MFALKGAEHLQKHEQSEDDLKHEVNQFHFNQDLSELFFTIRK